MRYRVTELGPPRSFAADYVAGPIEVAIRFEIVPAGQARAPSLSATPSGRASPG